MHEEKLVAYYKELIAKGELDFRTPKNGAVFYSGPQDKNLEENRKKAQELCSLRGHFLIENTTGGKYISLDVDFLRLADSEVYEIWSTASQKYAEQVSGSVIAFISGADPNRVFYQTELPALLRNEHISSINAISRNELVSIYSSRVSHELGISAVFAEISRPQQIEQAVKQSQMKENSFESPKSHAPLVSTEKSPETEIIAVIEKEGQLPQLVVQFSSGKTATFTARGLKSSDDLHSIEFQERIVQQLENMQIGEKIKADLSVKTVTQEQTIAREAQHLEIGRERTR